MPWNGAGTYSLPPAYSPEVNGTIIDANRYNGLTADVAAGVTAALAKNGENAATANLPMGGFKHTGAANAAASGQYAVWGQTITFGNSTISATDAQLTMNSVINNNSQISWQVGGVARWQLGKNTTAEGGVATGANLGLAHYDNTGVLLGTVFTIFRSSGHMTYNYGIGINGKAGAVAVAAPAVATDLATVITLVNDIRTRLINFGIYI